jgi:aquaporin Z
MDTQQVRACVAELIATFAVVFVGGGTVCAAVLAATEPRLDATGVALAEGLTLAVVLTATHRVSGGGANPALSLMLWVLRRIDGQRLVGYVVAQLLGAVLAGLALRALFDPKVLVDAHNGAPHLSGALLTDGRVEFAGILTGIGLELFFTALLAFAFLATLMDKRGPAVGGLMVGLAQAAIVLFGYRLTGGAANPARWAGTVIWELTLTAREGAAGPLADHAVYWVGPIVGALVGGFLYVYVLQPPEEPGKA